MWPLYCNILKPNYYCLNIIVLILSLISSAELFVMIAMILICCFWFELLCLISFSLELCRGFWNRKGIYCALLSESECIGCLFSCSLLQLKNAMEAGGGRV